MTAYTNTKRYQKWLGMIPFIGTRATTGVATTCTTVDVWYGVDIGTITQQVPVGPDVIGTDLAGADHKITLALAAEASRIPTRVYFYSAALGTSHSSAENFTLALVDVQDGVPSGTGMGTGAELLLDIPLNDVQATQGSHTLEVDDIIMCRPDAELRWYVKNRSASGHDFEIDPLRFYVIPCVS